MKITDKCFSHILLWLTLVPNNNFFNLFILKYLEHGIDSAIF